MNSKRRVGIVGFGSLGRYLYESIIRSNDLEVAFVWNRTPAALNELDEDLVLPDISNFSQISCDIIVEVSHPDVTKLYGSHFLEHADYLLGSPTVLADAEVENSLRNSIRHHCMYVPSGALWGGEDIRKMADTGMLEGLKVTMKKHPDSLKLIGELKSRNDIVSDVPTVVYEGPVRALCKMAPNNTNTMATAAIAAHNLGMDRVMGCLVADRSLVDRHVVEVEAWGPAVDGKNRFHVHTVRTNPAAHGAVTGTATYAAFLASPRGAVGKEPGIHLC